MRELHLPFPIFQVGEESYFVRSTVRRCSSRFVGMLLTPIAAAVGPLAARRGALCARTVRATAAAVGHGGERGEGEKLGRTHTNTRQSPTILEVFSVTHRA